MQLTKISYFDSSDWKLQDLELSNLNLIVGKNSIGKSRSLEAISTFVHILKESNKLGELTKQASHVAIINVEFSNSKNQKVAYKIGRYFENNNWFVGEILIIDDNTVLKRSGKEPTNFLTNYIDNKTDSINPPANKLIIHTHRDTQKYPYLEELAAWAETYRFFKFGDLGVGDNTSIMSKNNVDFYTQLSISAKENVLKTMQGIGYTISEISIQEVGQYKFLFVKEDNIKGLILHTDLSQGMFRALSTIIYIEYLIDNHQNGLLLIDDFCEGLDYQRATKLGTYVFERCEKENIQLVASSNDSFLMDIVDIKYWNILQREGATVTALNQQNNPDLFKKFMFTGLSNFDFFASDFIAQYQKANPKTI